MLLLLLCVIVDIEITFTHFWGAMELVSVHTSNGIQKEPHEPCYDSFVVCFRGWHGPDRAWCVIVQLPGLQAALPLCMAMLASVA